MARAAVSRLFSVAWTAMIITGVSAGILFVVVGSALDRAEHWTNDKLG